MADKQGNRIQCRSKEGLEADILMRAFSYGPIGETENIANCNSDAVPENTLNKIGDTVPPNFIQVDH